MSTAELWQQQAHPRPALLVGAAGQAMKARTLEYHGRMLQRMRKAEFLEQMRETRIPELSAVQMDERKLRAVRSQLARSCEQWGKDVAKARKEVQPEEDDWSVLEDSGTLDVIPDYGQPIEEQAMQ